MNGMFCYKIYKELIAKYGYIEVVDGRNLFFVCIKKPYLWEAYKVR